MMKKILARILAFGMIATSAMNVASCGLKDSGTGAENEPWEPIFLTEVEQAKNIILLIGDGMGPEQIRAGGLYKGSELCIQQFPYSIAVDTDSLNGTTDSAAGATAIATGKLTNNGYVGMDRTAEELETIADIAKSLGKSVGIVSTEEIYGATPMSFAGHNINRSASSALIESAVSSGEVDLFISSSLAVTYRRIFTNYDYTLVEDLKQVSEATEEKIFGQYSIMAEASLSGSKEAFEDFDLDVVAFEDVVFEALEYLSKNENGFFLMAEGAHIDHGGHNNDIQYMLRELLAFDEGVRVALEWAQTRDDTVVIVTADHETGGLQLKDGITGENMFDTVTTENGLAQVPAYYDWTTTGHTSTDIRCFINGANINFSEFSTFALDERMKNTDTFEIMKYLFTGEK